MQELHASLRVELLDNPQQSASVVADVAKAWATMLETIGVEVEASLVINETRAKPGRPRKPRLVPPYPLGTGHEAA